MRHYTIKEKAALKRLLDRCLSDEVNNIFFEYSPHADWIGVRLYKGNTFRDPVSNSYYCSSGESTLLEWIDEANKAIDELQS